MGMKPVHVSLPASPATKVVPMNWRKTPFNISIRVVVTGAVVYSVQYTNDDIRDPAWTEAGADWTNVTAMTAAVASAEATLISPVTAVRVVLTSGAGSILAHINSAGN